MKGYAKSVASGFITITVIVLSIAYVGKDGSGKNGRKNQAMSEEIRTEATCKCGRTIIRIQNSKTRTMWLNGDRYIYPEQDEAGYCIFRCDNNQCYQVVDELFKKGSK